MSTECIQTYGQLNEAQKATVIDIMIEGFGHLMTFAKKEGELQTLLQDAFVPDLMYAYLEDDVVLGILGLGDYQRRPLAFTRETCTRVYGKGKGKMLFKQMNLIFQTPMVKAADDLYVDILATTQKARCKGVATKLLSYAFTLPDYQTVYIDVLSKNENARRLYEKVGFVVYKKSKLSFIRLQGGGYPIKLKRERQ